VVGKSNSCLSAAVLAVMYKTNKLLEIILNFSLERINKAKCLIEIKMTEKIGNIYAD
jgi:hypothetical protein